MDQRSLRIVAVSWLSLCASCAVPIADPGDEDVQSVAQALSTITLTPSNQVNTSGYDFSALSYTGNSGGDFYFVDGKFWANNLGQRGLVALGPCNSANDVTKVPTGGYWTAGVSAVAGRCYVSLTHNEEHNNIVFRVNSLTGSSVTLTWKLVNDCYGLTDYRQHVNCWLSKNPTVGKRVIWEQRSAVGASSAIAWAGWSNMLRDELRESVYGYTSLVQGHQDLDQFPLADPPVNQAVLADSTRVLGLLSMSDAWRLYVRTVAMSLAVEINAYVPWSVTTYDTKSLTALFDSRNMLSYSWSGRPSDLGSPTQAAEGYVLVRNAYDPINHATVSPWASVVTPAPPPAALQFIRDKALKGATRRATIDNALSWARHLRHFDGTPLFPTSQFVRIWQYRGPAPASRMMSTTLDPQVVTGPYHFTAGCQGTSEFLHSVLRTLNIPVDANLSASTGHSRPRFMTEALTMSHGDDPYDLFDNYGQPADSMLIDDATYNQWFTNVSTTLEVQNLGRANPEAQIKNLTGRLQYRYCNDLAAGVSHQQGTLFHLDAFTRRPNVYPLSYLEMLPEDPLYPNKRSLWDRLATKIASQNGCMSTLNAIAQQQQACFAVTPITERLDCGL